MTPKQRVMFDYIAASTQAIADTVRSRPPQTPERARAAVAGFFSDPHVQQQVREQVAACAERGHDGLCPVCAGGTPRG